MDQHSRQSLLFPSPYQQQQQWSDEPHQSHQIKRESNTVIQPPMPSNAPSSSRTSIDDSMPSTSDFVKKLYKMLEEQSFQHVVSWGPQGDCFVVKDMNEFTKSILPRMFKHSNFASFVRQLNKYDFHKVKNTDDANQYGEQSWTFRHPDFHADRREALENIKRKVPAQRKQQQQQQQQQQQSASMSSQPSTSTAHQHHHSSRHHRSRRHRSRSPSYPHSHSHSYSPSPSPSPTSMMSPHQIHQLQHQIQDLHTQLASLQSQVRSHEARERDFEDRVRRLERGQGELVQGLVGVQRGIAMQDGVVRGLVGGWVGMDVSANQGTSEGKTQFQTQTQTQNQNLDQNTDLGLRGGEASASQQQRKYSSSSSSNLVSPGPANPNLAAASTSNTTTGDIHTSPTAPGGSGIGTGISRTSRGLSTSLVVDARSTDGAAARFGPGTSGITGFGGVLDNPEDVARASLVQMSEYSRRQRQKGKGVDRGEQVRQEQQGRGQGQEQEQEQEQEREGTPEYVMPTLPPAWNQFGFGTGMGSDMGAGSVSGAGMGSGMEMGAKPGIGEEDHEGLQVYTVGHLIPRDAVPSVDNGSGNGAGWSFEGHSGSSGLRVYDTGGVYAFGGEGEASSSAVTRHPLSQSQSQSSQVTSSSGDPQSQSQKKLRVRRSTFVPGWAVPPRVLLVDDDAVSRRLSSKFLQVFGCTIDVAVDGIGAVNKMNLEKYDLVLMDIVMPKLDGVSATSLIRKFDHMTPIISMTSNSKPNEIMTYYSSGMNDILPKPFTKEGLFDMLEKHLMHLKVIQQHIRGSSVPRSVGIPPLSDSSFETALTTINNNNPAGANTSNTNMGLISVPNPIPIPSPVPLGSGFDVEDDGRINPLAGMGLTDEQYSMILQNIVSGEGLLGGMGMSGMEGQGREKRELEEEADGRDGKRSRFEVIE